MATLYLHDHDKRGRPFMLHFQFDMKIFSLPTLYYLQVLLASFLSDIVFLLTLSFSLVLHFLQVEQHTFDLCIFVIISWCTITSCCCCLRLLLQFIILK